MNRTEPGRAPRVTIGVDVGGTFTDIFMLDEESGAIAVHKLPSSRPDQSVAFVAGVEQALQRAGHGFDALATVVHGTTVATNALLERKLARCGLLTTEGFRDVLEMRRRDRPSTWGLWGRFEPVIPRDLRLEVRERTLADGTIRTAVDEADIDAAIERLRAAGCEAVCVFFVNSYANPTNERAVRDRIARVWPQANVTASSDILPEVREFERASTAALNACLQPVVGRYVQRLERTLAERGADAPLLIVQSNGGLMSAAQTHAAPVRTALSGPAAGVIACAQIARAAGFERVITGDVGGTSFDVSLIDAGGIAQAAQTAIDFGLVIRTPMIEIQTIGAGGGSIARVDASGLLAVGPESAGSDPGPVCWGLRADDALGPTVTDANVVLGRINPRRPIGARPALDVEAARASIERHVARPLGIDVLDAAEAILAVANANMAGAMRLVSIERGHDPDHFAYMPFGGGGALHVCAMLREVGVARGLVPRYPGVSSALGCAIADMRHDFVQTLNVPLARLDVAAVRERLESLRADGAERLSQSGVTFVRTDFELEFDMLYVGQTHTVAVPVPHAQATDATADLIAMLRSAFETAYRHAFGKTLDTVPVRVLNLRLAAIGRRRGFDARAFAPPSGPAPAALDRRQVRHAGHWYDTPVHERLALPAGQRIEGPALFEQPDTTIWLEPGFDALTDDFGNLVVARIADGGAD